IVLDTLHQRCCHGGDESLIEALALALATWPTGQQPKIHFSTPRTELRYLYRNRQRYLAMPLPNQHSDFLNVFEFIDLLRGAQDAQLRAFDIMLEAKAKELALLRLRTQLATYAPQLAALIA